jgi:hypothetical protein
LHVPVGPPIEHHFATNAARPRTAAKARAGQPAIVDAAADSVGDEDARDIRLREGRLRIAGPGIANVAAKIAGTRSTPIDRGIFDGWRTVEIGGIGWGSDRGHGKRGYGQNQTVHAHIRSLCGIFVRTEVSGADPIATNMWGAGLRGD